MPYYIAINVEKLKFELTKIFKDNKGKVVIGQWPNMPLWIATGFYLIRFTSAGSLIKTLANDGFIATMLYWSYLEIFSGVNTWRRILGVIVGSYFFSKILFH